MLLAQVAPQWMLVAPDQVVVQNNGAVSRQVLSQPSPPWQAHCHGGRRD